MIKYILLIPALLMLFSCTSKREKAIQYNKSGIKNMFSLKQKEAMDDFNLAIDIDPAFDQPYFFRGNLKFSQTDYQGALADYSKAIELNNGFADAYANRGNLFQSINQRDKACADWKKAQKLGKENLEDKLRGCQ